MSKEIISTKNAPAAIGPYSQAIKVAKLPRDAMLEIEVIALVL